MGKTGGRLSNLANLEFHITEIDGEFVRDLGSGMSLYFTKF